MQETQVQSLGREDLLEKEMTTHFSILAWKIPWLEKPGRLQSMGSQTVGHDWATSLSSLSSLSRTPKHTSPSPLRKIEHQRGFFKIIMPFNVFNIWESTVRQQGLHIQESWLVLVFLETLSAWQPVWDLIKGWTPLLPRNLLPNGVENKKMEQLGSYPLPQGSDSQFKI